jgi:hypothetical protein
MTMLVSRYKITIKEEPQFAKETFEQRKNRVLKCRGEMTLTSAVFFLYDDDHLIDLFHLTDQLVFL